MSKNIRLAIVIAVLIVIAIIAGSRTVWSMTGQNAPVAQPSTSNNPAPAIAPSSIGSVEVPNCNGVELSGTGSDSVCGAAVITGKSSNTVVKAVQSPRQGDFTSKTITLYFTSGSVQLCFAAPAGGTVYYSPLNSTTWTVLPTTVKAGEACVTVSSTGIYAFGK